MGDKGWCSGFSGTALNSSATLSFSVWHNGSEIAQLQAELQKVKEFVRQEEGTSQNAGSHLPVKGGLAAAELHAVEEQPP